MTKDLIQQLISFIDLTTLDSKDNESSVLELVKKANIGIDGINPAAICVFPIFADIVSENTKLSIAVVAGGFPLGQTILQNKVHEINLAASSSANEIDVVINRGQVIQSNYDFLKEEIKQMKLACGKKHMKVILETGDLNATSIREASKIAIEEGADFIKTSTGKTPIGATKDAVQIMCEEIKTWHQKTGNKVGIKPSGGIRTFEDAMIYYQVVKDVLGNDWLNPNLFRIGASSLFDNLRKDLESL